MAKLTKSEWFIFLLNIALAIAIISGVIWSLTSESNSCWQNTVSETTNLLNCEEH